jgi:hypothetical protein
MGTIPSKMSQRCLLFVSVEAITANVINKNGFIISDGCRLKGPIYIHLWAPRLINPKNMVSSDKAKVERYDTQCNEKNNS